MTRSLWIEQTPRLPAEPEPLPARAEVAVIGGGVAGVSTAYHLARAGAAPVLLEAGEVASRASGRNDGQVLLGLGEHYNRIVGQFGAEQARLLWAFIRDNHDALSAALAEHGIDCAYADSQPGLRLAETPHEATELADAAALLAAEGISCTLHDAASLGRLLPVAHGFHGALELPGEATVQPVAMVRGLAGAARRLGARVFEDHPVTGVAGAAGDLQVTTAGGATITASVVVHCTSALGTRIDPTGFLAAQLFPFRGQILATDALDPELLAPFGTRAMSSNFCYEYFRTHHDRFVIGGMRWAVKGQEEGLVSEDGFHPEISAKLVGYVREHFPHLADVAFPHVWTGIMAGTGDGLPLLGELPGQPGVFAHLGFNGYGLSFAFLGGLLLAEQVVEGRSAHPAAPLFAPRRFA